MSYTRVDAALAQWASANQLVWSTEFKDAEVRSTSVVDDKGGKVQIWVDPPGAASVMVHVWDYRRRREDLTSDLPNLSRSLDRALAVARRWLAEARR